GRPLCAAGGPGRPLRLERRIDPGTSRCSATAALEELACAMEAESVFAIASFLCDQAGHRAPTGLRLPGLGIRLLDSGPLRSPLEEARQGLGDPAPRAARIYQLRHAATPRRRRGRIVAVIASLFIIFTLAGSVGVVYIRVNSLIAGFKSAEAHL